MKTILLTTALILATQSAAAYSFHTPFGEVKGDDVQVVKDTIKVAQKVGLEVANGVRDVTASVANATGVASVLEHNAETISHVGRAGACAVTLCYSEYHRQRELERLEAEQKEALRVDGETYQKSLTAKEAQDRLGANKKRLKAVTDLYTNYNEQLLLLSKEVGSMEVLNRVVNTEISYRAKIQLSGVVPEVSSQEMAIAAAQFENDMNESWTTAFIRLEPSIQKTAASTGRSIARIRSEVFRLISQTTLFQLAKICEQRTPQLQAEISNLKVKITETSAEMSFLQGEVAKGEQK